MNLGEIANISSDNFIESTGCFDYYIGINIGVFANTISMRVVCKRLQNIMCGALICLYF